MCVRAELSIMIIIIFPKADAAFNSLFPSHVWVEKTWKKFLLFCLQAEDLLDDILSFEAGSLSDGLKDGQTGSLGSLTDLQIKPEPLLLTDAELHALAKDRQKKDNHNMSKMFFFFV